VRRMSGMRGGLPGCGRAGDVRAAEATDADVRDCLGGGVTVRGASAVTI